MNDGTMVIAFRDEHALTRHLMLVNGDDQDTTGKSLLIRGTSRLKRGLGGTIVLEAHFYVLVLEMPHRPLAR